MQQIVLIFSLPSAIKGEQTSGREFKTKQSRSSGLDQESSHPRHRLRQQVRA